MNAEAMSITARELEAALKIVLEGIRERYGDSFSFKDDYFWDIPPEQLYDVYQDPSELTVGQVSESIDWVKRVASGSGEPVPYHLVWLADVLRALGHSLT